MVVPFKGAFLYAFLASVLALQCAALEGNKTITISFSLLSPPLFDLELIDYIIAVILREFFCQDANLILLDESFKSACYQEGNEIQTALLSNMAKNLLIDFLEETDPVRSYLVEGASHVNISEPHDVDDTTRRSKWDIDYEILQLGSRDYKKATRVNATNKVIYFQDVIQERLNAGIVEGAMSERLVGTGLTMLLLDEPKRKEEPDSQTIEDDLDPLLVDEGPDSRFDEENDFESELEIDFGTSALVLRYVGIVMLVLSVSFGVVLTFLGRRHRLKKERIEKEMIAQMTAEQRGLVTEQGVNLMLEIGRRESERMSNASV